MNGTTTWPHRSMGTAPDPGSSFAVPLLLALLVVADPARSSSGSGVSAQEETKPMTMAITSTAFANSAIPAKFTCEGVDASPPLAWTGVPAGTKSLALIMDDPDAPPGTWVHWVLYDLPAGAAGLPEGVPKKKKLDGGAAQGACWGVDSFSRIGYHGPCPPPGAPHRYFFKLYALDKMLGLAPGATKAEVLTAMQGHVLAEAELIGTYRR